MKTCTLDVQISNEQYNSVDNSKRARLHCSHSTQAAKRKKEESHSFETSHLVKTESLTTQVDTSCGSAENLPDIQSGVTQSLISGRKPPIAGLASMS